jgi:hypothetical protein
VAAIALHLLLVLLVLAPTVFVSNRLLDYTQRGAGGPGPVGGGGGGSNSFPGRIKYLPERVDFLKVQVEAVPKEEPVKLKPEQVKPPPPPTPPPPRRSLRPPPVIPRQPLREPILLRR